jgi:DNA-binding beta-propeller fold protein YncE
MKTQHLTLALSLLTGMAVAQQSPVQFNARSIVALSDADLTPSALIDNNLYRERGSRDLLTLIQLPLNRNGQGINSVGISNSMTLSDKTFVTSTNGRLAFVLEGRGTLPDSIPTLKNGLADLPASTKLTVSDLSSGKPVGKFSLNAGANATAVTINPQGNALLIASSDAGKEVKIIEVDLTGKPTRLLTAAAPVAGQVITDLQFHPGGQFVAYAVAATQEVGLLKYAIDAATKKPYIQAHGKPVKVGAMSGGGRFTSDGAFFVVTDAKKAASATGAGAGEVFVIQFSTDDTPGEHKIVGQAPTGESPEALAISPDGSVVVVANAGQSYQPFTNAAAGKSSLSVFALGKDGKLTAAGEVAVEGVMPQAVEFDKTGDNVAVAIPEYVDYGIRSGGIEFYKVTKGDKPTLTKQPGRVSVARGVHALRVVQ